MNDDVEGIDLPIPEPVPDPVRRSGFVTVVGRPNAGKSTLINQMLGQKVSIVSDKPQTTRHRVLGVLHRDDVQAVLVDTPGLHKPVTALGERLNATASEALSDVDVVLVVIDATRPVGTGDRWVLDRTPADAIVVLNKVDVASPDQIAQQLTTLAAEDRAAYFPVSARTGDGVADLVDHVLGLLPDGPAYFPPDEVTDLPEPAFVAELVREQLLAVLRDELPYSVATRIAVWEWPHVKVEILVERDSQKGMVIGKGGKVLKQVGTRVRRQLAEGAYLELQVKVLKDWQRRPELVDQALDLGGQ
ncbi:MAG: GTPase Era [Actinomycetota bacterium]